MSAIQFGPEGSRFNKGDLVQITDISGADEAKRQLAIVTAGSDRFYGSSFCGRTILPIRNNSGGPEPAEGWTIRKGRKVTPIDAFKTLPEIGQKVYGKLTYGDNEWVVGTVKGTDGFDDCPYIDVNKSSRVANKPFSGRAIDKWLPFDLDGATDGAAAGGEWKTSLSIEEFQPGAVIEVEAKLTRSGNTFSIGCFDADPTQLHEQADTYEVTKGNGAKATATLKVVTTSGGHPAVRLVGRDGPTYYRLVNVNAHVDRIRVVKPAEKPKPERLITVTFTETEINLARGILGSLPGGDRHQPAWRKLRDAMIAAGVNYKSPVSSARVVYRGEAPSRPYAF